MNSDFFRNSTRIGLAYNQYIDSLTSDQLAAFDYIEVPFELLHFNPAVFEKINKKPLILHCASLSLAGYTEPDTEVKKQIGHFTRLTNTPWIGEHLSFILAEKLDDGFYEEYAPGEPYNIGYTVGPVMNEQSVAHIVANVNRYAKDYGLPLVVENPPQYFAVPGSNITQSEFIGEICRQSEIELLLDLTHLFISSQNMGFDVKKELLKLPLHRVKEVHVSGVSTEQGLHWDNHADKAPDIIFEMLDMVMQHARPAAITLEYNWSATFPWAVLTKELERVQEIVQSYSCLK
jgi:uncharacterized protein (UPF0276 family)